MVKEKNARKAVLSVILLLAVIAALLCIYQFTKGKTAEGQKDVTVVFIHKDHTQNTFGLSTTREYLGELLKDEGLVEGKDGAYGMYITVADGEAADEANQEWWCLTKGGEQVNTSADQTPIADGDTYELTLTVGY